MNVKAVKYFFILSIVLLIGSTFGFYWIDKLYSPIIWFVALDSLIITMAYYILKKTNSVRVFGGFLVGIMIIYNLINYEPNWGIDEIFYFNIEHLDYSSRVLITFLLVGYGIRKVMIGGKFDQLIKSRYFIFSLILLFIFLMMEIPIYEIHGDYGGNSHGHNYFDGRHIH